MTYLLDANLLLALFDSRHVNHESAHLWFGEQGRASWATCPMTENGCVRVLSNPSYPTVQATPAEVMHRLLTFCASDGHLFWNDDVSLLTALSTSARSRLGAHHQVTDFYLACLAASYRGLLATFDGALARSLAGNDLAGSVHVIAP